MTSMESGKETSPAVCAVQEYGKFFSSMITAYDTGKPLLSAPVLRLQAGLKPEEPEISKADIAGRRQTSISVHERDAGFPASRFLYTRKFRQISW